MTSGDETAEKDLVGIRGWLLVYAIVAGLQTANLLRKVFKQWQSDSIVDLGGRLTTIFFFIAFLVGMYFLLEVRKPITRKFLIGLNSFWAVILLLFAMSLGGVDLWVGCVFMTIWALYWFGSERVRATYCHTAEQGE